MTYVPIKILSPTLEMGRAQIFTCRLA